MAKQKPKDKLTRIMQGALGAAERAIARADTTEGAVGTTLREIGEAVAEATRKTAGLGGEIRTAVGDAVDAIDKWHEFHVKPLERRLQLAQERRAAAKAEVVEIETALRELEQQKAAAHTAIAAAANEATEKLVGAADLVTAKGDAARAAERNLEMALQECRRAGGSVKDAIAKLARAVAQDGHARPAAPPVTATDGMSPELAKAVELAKTHRMSPEEAEAQRRSFAYGNAAIDNPHITREMVDAAADELAAGKE